MYSSNCRAQEMVAILEESRPIDNVSVETGKLTHVEHPKRGELFLLERSRDGSVLLCEDIGG